MGPNGPTCPVPLRRTSFIDDLALDDVVVVLGRRARGLRRATPTARGRLGLLRLGGPLIHRLTDALELLHHGVGRSLDPLEVLGLQGLLQLLVELLQLLAVGLGNLLAPLLERLVDLVAELVAGVSGLGGLAPRVVLRRE